LILTMSVEECLQLRTENSLLEREKSNFKISLADKSREIVDLTLELNDAKLENEDLKIQLRTALDSVTDLELELNRLRKINTEYLLKSTSSLVYSPRSAGLIDSLREKNETIDRLTVSNKVQERLIEDLKQQVADLSRRPLSYLGDYSLGDAEYWRNKARIAESEREDLERELDRKREEIIDLRLRATEIPMHSLELQEMKTRNELLKDENSLLQKTMTKLERDIRSLEIENGRLRVDRRLSVI